MVQIMKPSIGIDWDDVTAPFNQIAVDLANRDYKIAPPLSINEVTWGNTGRTSIITKYYNSEELYHLQKVEEKTKCYIRKLMKIANVYFITAVPVALMGIRAEQILTEFPEFPQENIILGFSKNRVHFDIILDDAIHNVLESPAEFPVLMRKPWNSKMTGILSVNDMEEFYFLVKQILESTPSTKMIPPSVLAIVGPTGTDKNDIVQKLIQNNSRFVRPINYSTAKSPYHIQIDRTKFEQEDFYEKTMYAGEWYGTKKIDIEVILKKGKFAVIPVDMCGAIALKKAFPTHIIYINKGKEEIIKNIISRTNLTDEQKTLRILSIDAERKNKNICDYIISEDNSYKAMMKICSLVQK